MQGWIWTQTNDPHNEVVAFRRTEEGRLEEIGRFATGGAGDAVPHLTSQGSVTLSGDGRWLLVTNAASDDLGVFAVTADGLEAGKMAPSGGRAPKSVAERDGLVYVLNQGGSTVTGLRLMAGDLESIEGSTRQLSAEQADAAQVGFTPDGRALVITERGTDSIVTFPVAMDGTLGEPKVHPSSGPTPYGFTFASGALVVTEAFRAGTGEAAASSYAVMGEVIVPVTRSVGNGRSEICWAAPSADGRFVFTTNFADGAVSRYAVDPDGSLTLEDATAGITQDGRPGLRDEDLSRDGRFLYAIDADQGAVAGWAVDAEGGLTAIGSWGGLPVTVAGLAAS
jgi:6-phosphogluconolactonase (cycloisomerase 2 family)